ncbi:MAG: hypothetical protein N2Z58_07930 [Fervidobacterium sp.]|nr:hypothetical protein [Fervidobacterium sp.]
MIIEQEQNTYSLKKLRKKTDAITAINMMAMMMRCTDRWET